MKELYAEQNLTGTVESAATADFNIGKLADHRSIAVAREFGIDLRHHRARQLTVADFERFDYIYGMDAQNLARIMNLAPDNISKQKVSLLADDTEIADPYSKDISAFRETYYLLKTHCQNRLLLHPQLKK